MDKHAPKEEMIKEFGEIFLQKLTL